MRALQGGGRLLAAGLLWASFVFVVLSSSTAAPVGSVHALPAGPTSAVSALVVGGASGSASASDPSPVPPALVASVAVGSEPEVGAVDTATGLVYVANAVSNNVSVLNGTTVNATVALPNVGTPDAVAYDAANGYVYVVDRYDFESVGGAVSVLDGTALLATVPVGVLPSFALVDPSTGLVYVTDSGSNNVTVVDGTTTVGSILVGTGPVSAAYDVADGDIYVANAASANVTVVSGTTVVTTLAAGLRPLSVSYDPLDDDIYVVNGVSQNATVFSGVAVVGNPLVGADPTFDAFNPSVGGVESANTNSSNVTVLSGTAAVATVAVAAGPVWLGLDPTGVFTFVVGEDANEVTVLNGTSVAETVPVGSVPVYGVTDPTNGLEYVLNSGSDNVSVFGAAFPVTFLETGLAPGVAWSVTLAGVENSSTTSSVGFTEPFGTYAYTIGTPSGYVLVSSVPASPIAVTDEPVTVDVTFAAVPTATYNLTFNETGLGKNCSQGGGMDGYGGSRCCMSTPLAWSVTVDGVTKTTTNSSVTFSEPNGVYDYTITPPTGYTVVSSVPPSPVTIDGANLTVAVTFARTAPPVQLSIIFREVGLPYGTTWCVTLNSTECSSGREIVFSQLPPGTYTFNVSPVAGFTARPSSGSVTLIDRSVVVCVRFTSPVHHHCM